MPKLFNFARYSFFRKRKTALTVSNYLEHLNEAQKKAVINTNGPALVIAGAGSGKTRVLTYRIAHLLHSGVKPWRILALTFTNKAAKEMKERIAALIGPDKVQSLWVGTFHSIFAKFLRKEADAIGYPSSFSIYDTVDSKNIIKSIINELKLDDKIYKPAGIYGRISSLKNNLITAAAYEYNAEARTEDMKSRRPELFRIYKLYAQRCFRSGAMDFDDLLLQTNILFRDRPDILERYQQKFDYILVDEYQDTNFSQYLIIKKLAALHKNICVVGDDAQSIYSFRGAKIENILNFQKDYADFRLFKLEQNYRSTKNIVNAANSVIEKNVDRINKVVFSEKEDGSKIKILEVLTDNEEGFTVVNKITDSIYSNSTEYSDHAILYRTNAQSRIFEEALRRHNIPYKIYGGLSFYQRKEIKNLLAYCMVVVNKRDDESLKRIINYPRRGIGKTSLNRIEVYALENRLSLWDVITGIGNHRTGVNAGSAKRITEFASMIKDFTDKLREKDAWNLAKEIADTSGILKDLFADKSPESIARHENVQELLNGMKEFTESDLPEEEKHLDHYLESVALLTNEDKESEEDKNKVTLMTIHSAKGLEFRNVYIVGAEERLFPSEMSSYSQKDLEEERRLFYVAVTRAEKELLITYTRQRYRWGKLYDCTPSRFIKDIDPKYIEFLSAFNRHDTSFSDELQAYESTTNSGLFGNRSSLDQSKLKRKRISEAAKGKQYRKLKKVDQSSGVHYSNNIMIKTGDMVKHARFGIGEVINIEGNFPNTKAVIEFKSAGKKNLLLKFAKLKVIG